MAIATFQTELDKAKAEIEGKDNAIANLETQISGVVAGNNDQVSAIAELETKLSGVMAELKARDNAIANLKPEPTPEPEPEPEPNPEPTGTLSRGELVKYILEKFPEVKINGQNITDAINGKSKNLPKFEGAYGFKYLGKINGVNRFQPILKP